MKSFVFRASSKSAMFENITVLELAVSPFVVLTNCTQLHASSHRSYWLKYNNKLAPESLLREKPVQDKHRECVSA